MFYALTWFVVLSLLTLWSLAVWAAHGVAVWTVSYAGTLTGAAAGVESLRLPEWLAPWVPPEIEPAMTSLLWGLVPAVDGLIQAAPALAGGLTVAVWVIWGLGGALLVLLGAGLHVLIAMWRSGGRGAGPHPRPQMAA